MDGQPTAADGGLGGPPCEIRDARLMERALRERWPISDEARANVVERLSEIVAKPGAKRRERIAAARALIAADALNVQASRGEPQVNVGVMVGAVAQVRIVELPANGRDSRPADTDDDDDAPARVEGTNGHTNGYTNGNGHAH